MRYLTPLLCVLVICSIARADATPQPSDPTARKTTRPATRESEGKDGDHISATHHSITLVDRTLRYTASAGTMVQRDESGAAKADMFFVAYTLDRDDEDSRLRTRRSEVLDDATTRPAARASTRPITFVFNGGPGAASVWLHLGTAGPRRLDFNKPPADPFKLIDNDSTWLDATDLVFIDPVGTGYSRPAQGVKGEQFYGVEQDVQSVGNFIRLYITRNRRWASPKFLAGESYGTTRAAGLSGYLSSDMTLNGVILISSVLNFQTLSAGRGNDLPYPLYLPSYTYIAHHYKKLPSDLQDGDIDKTIDQVRHFALNDYQAALAAGDALDDARRREIAQAVSRFAGVSVDYVLKNNLRIDPTRFRQQLLSDENKVIGRFDATVSGFASDPGAAAASYDPSLSLVLPVYSAALNAYVRDQLDFETDLPYEVLAELENWNFDQHGTGFLNVSDRLRMSMLGNPNLKLLVAAGKCDLATPFAGSDYTIDHLNLPPALRKNITRVYYPSGHMIYHDPQSRQKLHDDVRSFIVGATAEATSRP